MVVSSDYIKHGLLGPLSQNFSLFQHLRLALTIRQSLSLYSLA